jgi:hypothetical protein
MHNYSKLLSTSEFRELEDIEKAIKLHNEHQVSIRDAAATCGVKKSALERALKAVKEGRPWGVHGRPRLLSLVEEERLAFLVEEADEKQEPMTFRRFQEVVCLSPHFSAPLFLEFLPCKRGYKLVNLNC